MFSTPIFIVYYIETIDTNTQFCHFTISKRVVNPDKTTLYERQLIEIEKKLLPLRPQRGANRSLEVIMAIAIASVPVLKGSASDRFEQQMQESESRRGSVDFSKSIETARKILEKAKFI